MPMSDLQAIFGAIKPLLQAYQPPLIPKTDNERYFDLWSPKPIVIDGRKKKEVFFAGLIIQKSYVGFYFMPIYAETELKTVFKSELLHLLKGKSCFHVKKLDDELLRQIEAALKVGYELYQERGWVSSQSWRKSDFQSILEPSSIMKSIQEMNAHEHEYAHDLGDGRADLVPHDAPRKSAVAAVDCA